MRVPTMGDEQQAPPTPDEIQAKVGKRLDDVAKILAGALITVAGIMTTLGLSSDIVFVALNNESWPIYVASLCAILAIVCSIVALLVHPTRRGNLWETGVLVLGVIFYMVALSVAVIGAAKAAAWERTAHHHQRQDRRPAVPSASDLRCPRQRRGDMGHHPGVRDPHAG